MTKTEKIRALKNYREALIYATGYEIKEEKEVRLQEKKDSPKVLVLKRKWYGQDKKVC